MRRSLILLYLSLTLLCVHAQNFAVKTNVLYDATTTVNLGVEFALSPKVTVDLSGNYNPWTFSENKKLKHWLVQPEVRYWMCEKFNGHFLGFHAHAGEFNMGGIKLLGMEKYRYQGRAAGAGFSYGYQWLLNERWNLEASIGLGYTHLDYSKYYCENCGDKIGDEKKHFVGPTKAAVSLIYIIK